MKTRIFFRFQNLRHRQLSTYLFKSWGIRPSDISWYEKALRHKSLVGSGKFCHQDCNERLELLGDAVLDTVVTEYLFNRFPEADEGYLTKIRARIVNRTTLGEVGKNAGLGDIIEARVGSDDSMDKIIGNALEAWLGAIYIDRGFKSAKKSIDQYLLPRYLDIDDIIQNAFDFKSKLIEWSQQNKKPMRFDTYSADQTDNSFICDIKVNNKAIASGNGKSKKRAEQDAAKMACNKLAL
ncbi:MAG: ribonuclease III [Flavobacteriales bacterium]|nr:ribonuclease III [Flavobacteriales bacterium]MBT3964143.1 ribonuclease III [Flavobacteriales bacterium]MBT4705073.1 ribonuclease III [Flavobacteriales bacterium]MBT4930093.1 ribonuclease III [Flavobacteriales bacterium]MBT5133051.1 ribonuclease III [Flavobacteriales bacterium]